MKNFFYRTLLAIAIVILFYLIFNIKPNGFILLILSLCIFYLFVMFFKNIFVGKSKEKERNF